MKHPLRFAFGAASLLIGSMSVAPVAHSQTISLSNDDRTVLSVLQRKGFEYGRIVKRGLTNVRTHACKGGQKYMVKVSILGSVSGTIPLGNCDLAPQPVVAPAPPPQVSPAYAPDLKERLEREGYRRVVITDAVPPRLAAEACLDRDRYRLRLNRRGQVRSQRRIGPCERQFDPANLQALMEENGFDRVRVMQNRRPPYVVRACRDDDRMEVEVGRFGRLRDQRRIRACRTRIEGGDVASVLASAGFDRVRVLRSRRAPFLAEGCSEGRLLEVTLNRFGEITNRETVGRCATPVNREQLLKSLAADGYINVSAKRADSGWAATACKGTAKVNLRLDRFGDVQRERERGTCKSQTVLDMLTTLEERGARTLEAQVEGCFRNDRFRWTFDRLGNRTGRERVGSC